MKQMSGTKKTKEDQLAGVLLGNSEQLDDVLGFTVKYLSDLFHKYGVKSHF